MIIFDWNVEVYEVISINVTSNITIDVSLPFYRDVIVDVFRRYMGSDYPVDHIVSAEITLEETNVSYTNWDIPGSLEIFDVPYGYNLTLNITIDTRYYIQIFNVTTILVNRDSLSLVMFYFTRLEIYAYPEYNESIRLGDTSFEVFAGGTFIGTFFADERGTVIMDEFPMPSLYNLNPIYLEANSVVWGITVSSNMTSDLSGADDSYIIGVPQKLSLVTMSVFDLDGSYIDVDVEMYYFEVGDVILKEKIKGGIGTFDLLPQGNYSVRFSFFSMWGILVLDATQLELNVSVLEESFVVPVRGYYVETTNLLGDSLDDVYVSLYIDVGDDILDYNILGVSSGGLIYFPELPYKNTTILVNGTRRIVYDILIHAVYRLSLLEIVNNTKIDFSTVARTATRVMTVSYTHLTLPTTERV